MALIPPSSLHPDHPHPLFGAMKETFPQVSEPLFLWAGCEQGDWSANKPTSSKHMCPHACVPQHLMTARQSSFSVHSFAAYSHLFTFPVNGYHWTSEMLSKWDPQGGRREQIPSSCPLASTYVPPNIDKMKNCTWPSVFFLSKRIWCVFSLVFAWCVVLNFVSDRVSLRSFGWPGTH